MDANDYERVARGCLVLPLSYINLNYGTSNAATCDFLPCTIGTPWEEGLYPQSLTPYYSSIKMYGTVVQMKYCGII